MIEKVVDAYRSLEYGPAPESAGPALEWLDAHQRRFGHFIAGAWTPAEGDLFDTHNPANTSVLATVIQGTEAHVDAAVRAAREALPGWSGRPGHERARYLLAIARHIQKHARVFAVLESLDTGKTIRESRDIDIPLVARHFQHHAGWAQLYEQRFAAHAPIGVAGQITPWNFPLLMLAWKVAPALAAGCTVVLKPAEYTPLTALRFAELCQAVGLPPGVVNVVTGDGRTGEALVNHAGVDKIAFTGSTEVGRIIRIATAGTGRKLSLELGGKSPFIVFEDADIDAAIEGVVDAIWFNQGQVCCAGSRILVHESVAERVVTKLRSRMETLRIGDPLDKTVDMGAIVAPTQLNRIEALVEQGRADGVSVWQPSWVCPREGWFYPPTLLTDVAPAATIAQVEIFGPVAALMTFRTPDEAVALANDTRYGLAASVWTESINLALDIATRLAAGTVWINCTNQFDAAAGFGGYRESGFGRAGGEEGMHEYLVPAWLQSSAEESPRDDAVEHTAEEAAPRPAVSSAGGPPIDRTAKLYIGGRQRRPDQDASLTVRDRSGAPLGEVPRGNRKDIRNAVEAARAAAGPWARTTAHLRSQILYYVAENLAAREDGFIERLRATSATADTARDEVRLTVRRLFSYAAWADKWEGRIHPTPFRNVTLAVPEPLGVAGVVCRDDAPLLGFVSLVLPLVATGSAVVAVPSSSAPLAATDLYQVLDTSDVPGGVINIVTGLRPELVPTLAAHDDVDGIWYFADDDGCAEVERLSAGNLKRTWVTHGHRPDWFSPSAEGETFLRHATHIKNIWIPYGE